MKNYVCYLSICMLFIISSLPIQAEEIDSSTKSTIILKGRWEILRSLSPIPFTTSVSGDQLILKCTSPDYDINITNVNANGQPVWQCDIAAPDTSLFLFLSTAYLKVVTRLKSAMITVVTCKVYFSFSYGKGETDL